MANTLAQNLKFRSPKETLRGMGNQRLTPRNEIPARILVIPLDLDIEPFWATTENLSADGIFLRTVKQLPVDSSNLLKILTDQGEPLWVRSMVVHIIAGLGFGCKFVQIPEETLQALDRLFAWATPLPHVVFRDGPKPTEQTTSILSKYLPPKSSAAPTSQRD